MRNKLNLDDLSEPFGKGWLDEPALEHVEGEFWDRLVLGVFVGQFSELVVVHCKAKFFPNGTNYIHYNHRKLESMVVHPTAFVV